MRTKQEVINFLESKLGTKVPCKGNPSLDGQCVTLIKALLEFLGAPDPYKARGHANTCVATYLKEGIADPKAGFLSVFSNKNMADGYGHVWVNAGDGAGTYYESNGQKSLTVTRGKNYGYDNFCNLDKYIKEDDMSETYKGLDLSNTESVKAAIDTWKDVIDGKYVKKSELKSVQDELEGVRGELKTTQGKLEKALKQAAETTPTEAWEEQKRLIEEKHEKEIEAIRMQQDERIEDATKILKKNLTEAKGEISRLNDELLQARQSWKHRFTSRKFLLTVPTAIFNMGVAFAVLLGFHPDPGALATALTSLNAVVALFVVPEAITDHKERLSGSAT